MNANVNTMISSKRNGFFSNDIYIKKEDEFHDEDIKMNASVNSDLTDKRINNKYMVFMNKGNFKEKIDRNIEFKNIQSECGIEEAQSLNQYFKINNSCTDLEKNVIIKEEIVIPADVLESDSPSNEFSRKDEKSTNKVINWFNTKSILKPKIYLFTNGQEQIKVVNANIPASDESLESESNLESPTTSEKEIKEQMPSVEVLKNVKSSRQRLKPHQCVDGFISILKNISKLEEENMLKKVTNELKKSHQNNDTLNIKIENVVSHATSLLQCTQLDNPSVGEEINVTNPVSQAKSILKPKIHILDTKCNKIIIKQSKLSGRTELIRAKKIVTPSKVIEKIKDKCVLYCTKCLFDEPIHRRDKTKKCALCLKKLKYKCSGCEELFSSSVQFYVHDSCFCKVKIKSGYYWKCNECNYLVHKMTNCHENFCRKHPSLKCKYCFSDTVHLSEFKKYSMEEVEENWANSIDIDQGNVLECTPLSLMPGQELNAAKKFVQMCSACKYTAPRSSANSILCSDCGLVMRYKCLRCEALLKTYKSINRHCNKYCYSERTYYCASCDVFTKQGYDYETQNSLPEHPTFSTHRCRNCLARFDSRCKLNAHRRSCAQDLLVQCGLCPLKLSSPRTLRDHLEEIHRQHTSVGQRARVFKLALRAWRRSIDLLKWRAKKIPESEKIRLKNEKMPLVLLNRLSENILQNLGARQELWTYDTSDTEDILPHECVSATLDEVDEQSTFYSQQTAYLNNINSLLEIPDSDEEVIEVSNTWLHERIKKPEIPFIVEEKKSHNISPRKKEKLLKQKVLVEKSMSKVKKLRIRKHQTEPLRCEHCSYLTDAKKELVEHIMGRHAARLFRGVGFDCPRCSCVFNNYFIYERHLQSRHPQR